ncbi:MAG: hypothetical protein U0166_20045 [Acidobacteriota bacterium]
MAAVASGGHTVNGLRNRDVRQCLYGDDPLDPKARRSRSARVSRLLRLLRAHGLLSKVPKSHRYQITKRDRLVFSAMLAASEVTLGHSISRRNTGYEIVFSTLQTERE